MENNSNNNSSKVIVQRWGNLFYIVIAVAFIFGLTILMGDKTEKKETKYYEVVEQFRGGEGIVTKGVENTIRNVGILGHDGMKATDKTIMDIMLRRTC